MSQLLAGATSAEELIRVLEPEGAREKANAPKPSEEEMKLSRQPGGEENQPAHAKSPKIVAGVVEVYVIDNSGASWRVLALRRATDAIRPGSWETVFGKISDGESPPDAALREVGEETGLAVERLYNVNVQPFYLHASNTVQLSIVFAVFVKPGAITLSAEHAAYEWLALEDAHPKFTWPRAADALRDIRHLLAGGDAGPVEDVLRVL